MSGLYARWTTFIQQPYAYLSVLFVGFLASRVWVWIQFDVDVPLGGGGPVWFTLIYVVVAMVLWIQAPPTSGWTSKVFVILLLITWAYVFALGALRREPMALESLFPLLILPMVAAKPPRGKAALPAADALSWGVLGAAAVSLALELAGWMPSWYATQVPDLAEVEVGGYWKPFAWLLGLEGRWGGFAGHPNVMAPLGALLIVYGVSRPGVRRGAFVGGGAAIVMLAASRSTYLVVVVGLLVWLVAGWVGRTPTRARILTLGALLTLFAVAAAAIFRATGGGLSGREGVWPVMLDLWRTSPVFGVGEQGFAGAIEAGNLPGWAYHGHSLVIDALTRNGALGALLVIAVLGYAMVVSFRAAMRGWPAGLAVVVVIVVNGLSDDILKWSAISVPICFLLVAVLVSDGWRQDDVLDDGEPPASVATALS